jgi:hypothetical protein
MQNPLLRMEMETEAFKGFEFRVVFFKIFLIKNILK